MINLVLQTDKDLGWGTALWSQGISLQNNRPVRMPGWAVWHSCRMGARNQEQTRGRIGPQLRVGNLRVGELHFCPLCTALDQASSLSRKLAYVPGPTFGFVKPLASSGSHCTKWADEQHRQAGFESRLLPDLPLPFIPTLIGLRAFDLVLSRVWWEAATNTRYECQAEPKRAWSRTDSLRHFSIQTQGTFFDKTSSY